MTQRTILYFMCLITFVSIPMMHTAIETTSDSSYITIAILAKDKAHSLPFLLKCIEHQTWPKNKTYIYIRTNNNNDNTKELLEQWVQNVQGLYPKIYFNGENVEQQVQQYGQHEWNSTRFKVLGKIRQDSAVWAYENNSHYFVVDCDNFIQPNTIESMFNAQLPIVAPFLTCCTWYGYSNYHAAVDTNGYYASCDEYMNIFHRHSPGLHPVPVVHCTYFIQRDALPFISYDDNSYRYEYVIFSDVARKNNIAQYLDNRQHYGYISFAENSEALAQDGCLAEVMKWFAQ